MYQQSPGLSSTIPQRLLDPHASSSPKRSRFEFEEDEQNPDLHPLEQRLATAGENDMPFFINAPMNRLDRLEHLNLSEGTDSWTQLLRQPATREAPPVGFPGDLVDQGILSEERLQEYWWHFHTKCSFRIGSVGDDHTLVLTRKESPLLLAAVCSVGARSLQSHQDAVSCFDQAKLHARDLVFYSDLKNTPADYLDLKGLLILSIYWALPHLMGQSKGLVGKV